jgi:hypothetical protein
MGRRKGFVILWSEGISFGIIRASKNSWNQGLIDLL